MNVVFYLETCEADSIIKGWEIGLKTCGIKNFIQQHKSLLKSQPLDFVPDLIILENPSEFELDILSEIKSKQILCIVGCEYKTFYKKYPFVNLWVEPVFYDKNTEKSFSNDNLPFYYCPLASQDSIIPFYTELDRPYDLSTNLHMNLHREQEFKVANIPVNEPNPEKIYGISKINYNYQFPRKDFIYLNQRSFDIPMSGNFELSTIEAVKEIFEGRVAYDSENDGFRDLIRYYINHEEERTRMAIKGYEVCIAKHTYTYRMRDLLKKLKL